MRKIAAALALVTMCVGQQGNAQETAKSDVNPKLWERTADLRAFYCIEFFKEMYGDTDKDRQENLKFSAETAVKHSSPDKIGVTRQFWYEIIFSYEKIQRYVAYRLSSNAFDQAVAAYAVSEYRADASQVNPSKNCRGNDFVCTQNFIEKSIWRQKTRQYCFNSKWLDF